MLLQSRNAFPASQPLEVVLGWPRVFGWRPLHNSVSLDMLTTHTFHIFLPVVLQAT